MKTKFIFLLIFLGLIAIDVSQAQEPGNCLNFDGEEDYVSLNDFNLGTSDFTIEAWIYPTVDYGTIITNRNDNFDQLGNWFSIGLSTGLLSVEFGQSNASVNWYGASFKMIPTDQWTHFAVQKSGTSIKIFINGDLDNELEDEESVNRNITNSGTTIGGWSNNSDFFQGCIDQVQIWSVPITLSEIQNSMVNKYFTVPSELIGYYDFNQGSAGADNAGIGTLPDLSQYPDYNNGTLSVDFILNGETSNWVESFAMVVPENFQVVNLTPESFDLTWDAPINGSANDYYLQIAYDHEFSSLLFDNITTSPFNQLCSPGTEYFCRVVARNIDGVRGGYSKILKFQTPMFPPGNCLNFDGTDDYVEGNYNELGNFGTGDFTIEAWIRTSDQSSPEAVIVSNRYLTGNSKFFVLYVSSGYLSAQIDNGVGDYVGFTGNKMIANNIWHHVALVRQGTNVKLFVDGKLDNQINGTATCDVSSNEGLDIGARNNQGSGYFKFFSGDIDEVRIWDIARDELDIIAKKNTPLNGDEAGLIAYYNFDQGMAGSTNETKTTLFEKVNNYEGTLQNFELMSMYSNWVESFAMVVPENLHANDIYRNSVNIVWDIPNIGQEDISGYNLDVATDPEFLSIFNTYYDISTPPQYVNGLSPFTKYYFRVRAKSMMSIEGAPSNIDSIITADPNEINSLGDKDTIICQDFYQMNAIDPNPEVGTWTKLGGSLAEISSPNDPYTNITGIPFGTTNKFVWTVGAFRDTFTITNHGFIVDLGTDPAPICSDEFQLMAPNPDPGTGVWTLRDAGYGEFDNSTDENTWVRNMWQGTNTFRWTVYKDGCAIYDEISIFNDSPDDAIINYPILPEDRETCDGTISLTPDASITYYTNAYWSQTTGTGQIDNTAGFNVTYSNLSLNTNVLRWTVETNNCSDYAEVAIENNEVSTDAGSYLPVCENQIQLMATPLGTNENGYWTTANGGVYFDDSADPNTIAHGLPVGTEVGLTWYLEKGNCLTSSTTQVYNNSIEALADNDIVCESTGTLFSNNVLGGGETGWWTIEYPNTATFVTSSQNPICEVEGLSPGPNQFTWYITNTDCSASQTIMMSNNSFTVDADISDADNIVYTCSDTYQLNAENPVPGTGFWSTFAGNGSATSQSIYNSLAEGLDNSGTIFEWHVEKNGCEASDQVTVIDDTPSTAFITSPSTEIAEICNGTINLMAANPSISTNFYWEQTSGSSVYGNSNSLMLEVTDLSPNTNVFRWTVESDNCTSTDEVTITNNIVTADAGFDQTICENTATLTAAPYSTGETGFWTVLSGGEIEIANSLNNITNVYNLMPTVNTFRWTVQKGNCEATSDVTIISQGIFAEASDQANCIGEFNLDGNNPADFGATGWWEIVSGDGFFVGSSVDNVAMFNGVSAGTSTTLRWNIDKIGCDIISKEIVLTNDNFSVSAGVDENNLCSPDYQLQGDNPAPGTGIWEVVNGSGSISFDNQTLYNTWVRNLDQELVILSWTVEKNGCVSSASVSLTNNSVPIPVINTTDGFETCDGTVTLSAPDPLMNGVWSIPGDVTIANPSNYTTTASGLVLGANPITWTINNENCSNSAQITVVNNQVSMAAAGSNQTICENFTTLSANQSSIGEVGYWDYVTPTGNIANQSLYNSEVTDLISGENTFSWTIERGNCSTTDEVTIFSSGLFAEASNQVDCFDEFILDGNIPAVGAWGEWTITEGEAIIANSNNYNTSVTGIPYGTTVSLIWTVSDGICSVSKNISLTNNGFIISAGANKTICENEIQLEGQFMDNTFGEWILTDIGYGDFDNPTLHNTWVRNLAQGENIFNWFVSNTDCENLAEVSITSNKPSDAIILNDLPSEICNSQITLSANAPDFGIGYWQQNSGTGMTETISSSEVTVDGISLGNNTFEWIIDNFGCKTSAILEVINNEVAGFEPLDETICGNTFTLNAPVVQSDQTGYWLIYQGYGEFDDSNSNTTSVTNLGQGPNTFEWILTRGGCSISSYVNVSSYPLEVVAFAGEDKFICEDNTILEGNDPFPYQGEWSLVPDFGGGEILFPNLYNSEYTTVPFGINKLAWTISNGECSSSDTVVIERLTMPEVFAGDDNLDYLFDPEIPNPIVEYVLNATPVEFPFIGTWTSNNPNNYFDDTNAYNATAYIINSGNNHFTWTVTAGECYDYSEVDVHVRRKIQNSANKEGSWQTPEAWLQNVVPTKYDSVVIKNGIINLLADSAKAYKLFITDEGTLNVDGGAKGEPVLNVGDFYVYQSTGKIAKGNANANVRRGGKVNIEQDIDKSAKGSNGSVHVRSGGKVNIEQDIDKSGSPSMFSVDNQIEIRETVSDLTAPTAEFFIGNNGEVILNDNAATKSLDRLLIQDGGFLSINDTVQTNYALSILGGGNLVIEHTGAVKGNQNSHAQVRGGKVNIEQDIDKGVSGSVHVRSGGKVNIEQDIDKGSRNSELTVPQIEITDGTFVLGNESPASVGTCLLNTGYIFISQTSVNETGVPNFVIASGGILDLDEIPELGNTSFIEVGENGSVTFDDDAQIINEDEDIILIEIDETASVIDSTDTGGIISGLVELNKDFYQGTNFFAVPLTGISPIDFPGLSIYNWSESENSWNILMSELEILKGYKVDIPISSSVSMLGLTYEDTYSIELTNSDLENQNQWGWNLIGNPFTSAIDWEEINLSGIENSLYMYNPETENFSIYQQGGFALNGGNQLIPLSEGFFVKVNPENSSAIFNLGEGKVHNIPGLLKLKEVENKATSETVLLTLTNDTYSDETILGLETETSTAFESNKDAYKMFAEIPQIYTKSVNDDNLAINVFDIQEDEIKTIPLNISSTETGSFTINSDVQISNSNINIYLHDFESDEFIDLRTNPDYDFTFNSSETSERFEIVFDYTIIDLNEQINNQDVAIYSWKDNIYIKTYENIEYTVEIYTLTGAKIFVNKYYGKNIHTINNVFNEGIYVVKVSSKNNVIVKNVFVK